MKSRRIQKKIWVAVKVERGLVSEVKAFQSYESAKRTEQQWRKKINPDYDETDVVESFLN